MYGENQMKNFLMILLVMSLLPFFVSCGDDDDDDINDKTDTVTQPDDDNLIPANDNGGLPQVDKGNTSDNNTKVDDDPANDDDPIIQDDEPEPDDEEKFDEDFVITEGDADGDGISDDVEKPNGIEVDTDGDGTPDFMDVDSDGDGISDKTEGTDDPDGDSIPNYRDTDSDGDYINDSTEAGADKSNPVDTDLDGTPDYQDKDSDNDTIPDIYEGPKDADEDGTPNYLDTDSDNDGFLDSEEVGPDPSDPLDTDNDLSYDFIDNDSDGDGLSDADEKSHNTNPVEIDSDGDGFDDMVEIAYGSNPLDPNDGIAAEDFYVVLPYEAPLHESRILKFSTNINSADVLIMIDLSNSMAAEIDNLKANIGSVITNIQTELPDTQFGLISFGTWSDTPYTFDQTITSNSTGITTAINALSLKAGWYEPHEEVFYQAATGEGLTSTIALRKVKGSPSIDTLNIAIPATNAGFRDGALPIFLMATDEAFQGYDMPNITDNYYTGGISGSWTSGKGHTLAEATAEMNDINAKFIGINSTGDAVSGAPLADFTTISNDTNSKNNAGEPFHYTINSDGSGTGLDVMIAQGVTSLLNNLQMDVDTLKESVSNTPAIDTTQFIKAIVPESAIPSEGITGMNTTTFLNVKPGTEVNFNIDFYNDFYKPDTSEAQMFEAKINVMGEGAFLDTRDVYIIVPGTIAPLEQ